MARQLTTRARRVLEDARGLLAQLRALAGALAPPFAEPAEPGTPAAEYLFEFNDPLARFYRDTAAIADTTLRMVPYFPDSATGQLHLCEGLEPSWASVGLRLQTLTAVVEQHRKQVGTHRRLAELLAAVEAGQLKELQPFQELADVLIEEVRAGEPLRFLSGDATQPARFVAAHSLNVARVVARIARHDADLKTRLQDVVVGALLHDVGMLRVPAEILAHSGLLTDDQRRQVETHPLTGARLLEPIAGDRRWLIEAASNHHERLDGTGYPSGMRSGQVGTLARLLAVCDCYTSLCSPRPYRPAREPRTALTDTLLLAEQGHLDGQHAEHLLQLSFYPLGSAVELADGAVGVVVSVPSLKRDLNAASRPVLALLFDSDKQPLSLPCYLDLAQVESHSIVRTLSPQERRDLFGGASRNGRRRKPLLPSPLYSGERGWG